MNKSTPAMADLSSKVFPGVAQRAFLDPSPTTLLSHPS